MHIRCLSGPIFRGTRTQGTKQNTLKRPKCAAQEATEASGIRDHPSEAKLRLARGHPGLGLGGKSPPSTRPPTDASRSVTARTERGRINPAPPAPCHPSLAATPIRAIISPVQARHHYQRHHFALSHPLMSRAASPAPSHFTARKG